MLWSALANAGESPEQVEFESRLHRDRMTLTIYFSIGFWGWFIMSIGPMVPLITKEFGVSKGVGGLHGTAIAVGAVAVGLVSHRLVQYLGRRPIMLIGTCLMTAGALMLAAGPNVVVTLAGAMIIATGGNLIVNVAQPALSVQHKLHGPAAVTEANAVSAVAGIFGPLALGGAVMLGWGWRPANLVTVVLGISAFLLISRLPTEGALDGRTRQKVSARSQPRVKAPAAGADKGYTPAFWFFVIGVTSGVAIELSTSFWAADLIGARTGAGDGIASAVLSALFAGMALARIIGGRLAMRYAPEKLMILAFGIAGVGWLLLWTSTHTGLSFAALLLTGIGFGLHYPLGVALVMRASEGRPDAAQAIATVSVGIATALAPFALGALADRVGSHQAFVIVPIVAAIGTAAVYLGLRDVHKRLKAASGPQ